MASPPADFVPVTLDAAKFDSEPASGGRAKGSRHRLQQHEDGKRKKRYGSRAGRRSGVMSDGEEDESDDGEGAEVIRSDGENDEQDELIFSESDEAIHVQKAYRESVMIPSSVANSAIPASTTMPTGKSADQLSTAEAAGKEKEKETRKRRAMTFTQLKTFLTYHKDDKSGTKSSSKEDKEREKERKREEREREKMERAFSKGKSRRDLQGSGGSKTTPLLPRPSGPGQPPVSPSGSQLASSPSVETHPFKNHAGQTPLHIAIDVYADKISKGQADEEDIETVSVIMDDAKVRSSYKTSVYIVTLVCRKEVISTKPMPQAGQPCIAQVIRVITSLSAFSWRRVPILEFPLQRAPPL